MKIGLAGYKGSGKSSLFHWLSGITPDLALSHSFQSASIPLPEPRFKALTDIYHPKKTTYASIELVDTPGLSRDDQQSNPQRLALLREADALVWVVPVFGGNDPVKEINAFREDTILADLEIVLNRIEKVTEQNKRPVPKTEHEKFAFELETLKVLQEGLESGHPVQEDQLTLEQQRVVRGFRLLNGKPKMFIFNTADEETDLEQYKKYAEKDGNSTAAAAVSVRLELELSEMTEEEKKSFLEEMQLPCADKDAVLKMLLDTSGQSTFLTAGEKEIRTWLMPKGGTAIEAAGSIHTDMVKGFIRAEVIKADDLIRLGSERAVKAEGLITREPKDYVVKDGDILLFHFS
ncbi:ribosome-binding ATPase YchF [Planctomycetales bacterium]|nr:ribosome-binding ATPase YchF [Planctomycetales bacterium]GHT34871.1 ribosome-binding ATPase YchF [Planctomycetales bacterium]